MKGKLFSRQKKKQTIELNDGIIIVLPDNTSTMKQKKAASKFFEIAYHLNNQN